MAKMTERELKATLLQKERQALGYLGGELTEQRRKALKYYNGEPFGNEVEGRSQVVSSDVADTIEWILPSLLEIFASGDEVVKFEPQGPEDEPTAEQATEYVNWIFQRDNPGFLILYTLFKDALLQKNGVAKVWWGEKEEDERVELMLAPEEFAILQTDPDIEVIEEDLDEETGQISVVYRKKADMSRVCIENVPPEEFLIDRRAKSIDEAGYVAHRVRRTLSDLIAEGYPKSKVMDLSGGDDADLTEEGITRRSFDDTATATLLDEDAGVLRQVWVREAYLKVDWDDDGIAEWRQVTYAGEGEILKNEEWAGTPPFVSITPIIMPHRFFGKSIADLVMDLQLIKSTLWRQTLDNLYLSNAPRHAVSDQVNLDDLLTVRPGGVVRLKGGAVPGQGHIVPIVTPFVAGATLPMMEFLDQTRENRTGVTRYNQGIDANSLNKTASGITQIMNAAQQRIQLIARIFAETGVKDLFLKILQCVSRYQSQPRIIRLRNDWVPMDPRGWESKFDLMPAVGLGRGNKDQIATHLQMIIGMQAQAIQFQGGIEGPIVTGKNIYESTSRLQNAMGFKGEQLFFSNPEEAPPQQPKPDPKMMEMQGKMQMEQQKLQMEGQKTQAQLAMDQKKLEADITLQREKLMAELMLKREGMQMDLRASDERFKGEMDAKKGRDMAEIKAGMGISPDNEKLDGIEQGLQQMAQLLVDAVRGQQQMSQAILQAVTAQKQIAVQRDASGRIVGATASPTIQ